MTSGPKPGSRTTPRATSTPVTTGCTRTGTSSRPSSSANARVAATTSPADSRPTRTRPRSVLWTMSRSATLTTTGKPSSDGQARGIDGRRARCRPRPRARRGAAAGARPRRPPSRCPRRCRRRGRERPSARRPPAPGRAAPARTAAWPATRRTSTACPSASTASSTARKTVTPAAPPPRPRPPRPTRTTGLSGKRARAATSGVDERPCGRDAGRHQDHEQGVHLRRGEERLDHAARGCRRRRRRRGRWGCSSPSCRTPGRRARHGGRSTARGPRDRAASAASAASTPSPPALLTMATRRPAGSGCSARSSAVRPIASALRARDDPGLAEERVDPHGRVWRPRRCARRPPRWPPADRPPTTASSGLRSAKRRAIRANFGALPNDSR